MSGASAGPSVGDGRDGHRCKLRRRVIAAAKHPARSERCAERIQVVASQEACCLDRAVCADAQLDAVAYSRGVVARVSGREVDEPLIRRADQGALFLGMIGQVGAVNKQVDRGDETGCVVLSFEGLAGVAGEADDAQTSVSSATRERRARSSLVEGLTPEKSKAFNACVERLRDNDLGINGLTPARAEQVRIDAALAANAASLHPNSGAQPWALGRGAVEHPTDAELGVRTQVDGRPQG